MSKRKLKVGDKISWKSYSSIAYGIIEKIVPDDRKTIKARPTAGFSRGYKPTLVALYEYNVTLIEKRA